MKYRIEAEAEATVWEYRYYEIEADSEEDAMERCSSEGFLIDSIETDYSLNNLVLTKISHDDVSKEIKVEVIS